MEPGRPASGPGGQTSSSNDPFEGDAQFVRVEWPASAVDEDGLARSCCGSDPILAGLQVVGHNAGGARVDEHQPGLAELGLQYLDHAVGYVDVVDAEAACLAGAHPGGREQADQRSPRQRFERR